jgi:hypothetical protein
MSQQYDNKGQAAFWKNPKYEPNNKQPALRGNVVLDDDYKAGDVIEISLWPNQSDNERAPTLKGKAQRPNPKFANNAPAAAPAQPVDDSIPF